MNSPYRFIITPLDGKYTTSKKVKESTLYLTASIEDAKYVSRIGIVLSVPLFYKGNIKEGDIVILHHNIFRDYYNQNGKVVSSFNYLNYENQDLFLVYEDLIYLYKSKDEWIPHLNYCFVRPIKTIDEITKLEKLDQLKGKVVYSNDIDTGTLVGFLPESEYEFEINNEILYRMKTSDICLIL